MICAAAKKTRDGKPSILIVALTPNDRARLARGGCITHPFEAIDPTLGPGQLIVAGVESEEQVVRELAARFEIGRVVRLDDE